jgi:hypothetical protein
MKETTVAMLDMSKTILEKVSFDRMLFRKELSKAVQWLKPDEKMLLKVWALATFGHMYKDIILDVYKSVTKS